jgi:hypothetical protein
VITKCGYTIIDTMDAEIIGDRPNIIYSNNSNLAFEITKRVDDICGLEEIDVFETTSGN